MLEHEQSYNSNLLSEQTVLQNIGGKIAFKRIGASANRHGANAKMQATFLQPLQKLCG